MNNQAAKFGLMTSVHARGLNYSLEFSESMRRFSSRVSLANLPFFGTVAERIQCTSADRQRALAHRLASTSGRLESA